MLHLPMSMYSREGAESQPLGPARLEPLAKVFMRSLDLLSTVFDKAPARIAAHNAEVVVRNKVATEQAIANRIKHIPGVRMDLVDDHSDEPVKKMVVQVLDVRENPQEITIDLRNHGSAPTEPLETLGIDLTDGAMEAHSDLVEK